MPRSTPHRRALCFTPLQWLRTEAAAMTTALRIRGTPAEPRSRPPIKRALPDPVTPCEWISLRGVWHCDDGRELGREGEPGFEVLELALGDVLAVLCLSERLLGGLGWASSNLALLFSNLSLVARI